MTPEQVQDAARMLFEAEQTRDQCGLLSIAYPDMNLDDAYAVQAALVDMKLAAGAKIIGWKIGLTSRAMQQALNITTPDSGVLFDDMLFETDGIVPKGRFIQPRIEAEIAFVTKAEIKGPGCHIGTVLQATDIVLPAVEILDSRYENFNFDLISVVADNTSAAGFVTGGRARKVEDLHLPTLGIVLEKNGEVVELAAGAAVLGHPAESVVMLANMLARKGQSIPAGTFIMTGGVTAAVSIARGDHIAVRYQDLGSVSLKFV